MKPPSPSPWFPYAEAIQKTETIRRFGRVSQVVGMVIQGIGPAAAVGDVCHIPVAGRPQPIPAEVVGFRDEKVLLMPLGEVRGIDPGCRIMPLGAPAQASVGRGLLGRVLDGLGQPMDEKGPVDYEGETPLYARPLNPVLRKRITQPVDVGVRAINALLTIGRGQRMAIFSGSGVGKSTLMGMMARHTTADVNVIALIGERGREVREFLEKDLGEEGLKRSVVVVATSDRHPLLRMRGAYLATALAVGEPPTAKGYTPSVFAQLPRLLERAGTTSGPGSITGIYTVLVDADDLMDPIADAIRSIADGHIVLSRDLANQNHYPAIDVLGSISRVMGDIVIPEQIETRNKLVTVLATYRRSEDLINIGAYVAGSNPSIDYAIKKIPEINSFLRQAVAEKVSHAEAVNQMKALFK
jgi:flagellum-specific ATP synthase